MNARINPRDALSKRQIEAMKQLAIEEYQKHAEQIGDEIARRIIKLCAQAMYEVYGWNSHGFQRVVDRVMSLDNESDTNRDLMSHIDRNLDKLGYKFEHENPDKWVVK